MEILKKDEKGFSLIELLVVIAIIGVLAAVGLTNYQGFIDSAKKDTTEASAEDIHRTLSAYAYKESYEVSACNSVTDDATMLTCLQGLYASGGPFENKDNPYNQNNTAISAINVATPHGVFHDPDSAASNQDCTASGNSAGVNGQVVIANDTSASGSSYDLSVYYCSEMTVSGSGTGAHWTKTKNTIQWD